MNLSTALRLRRGDVVSLTGGGGKTTAMFRLARELAAAGWRVVSTSTTRIFASQTHLAPCHLRLDQATYLPFELTAALATYHHVLVTGQSDDFEGKAHGVPPGVVDAISRLPGVDITLVEADGARMRPIKAPASHEPVIPASTTLLVPVIGLDALGRPLTEAHVHRPALLAAVTGLAPGAPITLEAVGALLSHPAGGVKGAPAGVRVTPLLNQADVLPPAQVERVGLWLRRFVRQARMLDAVVLGAVATEQPAGLVSGRTAGVILAGGAGRRFGQIKQLWPWQGATMLNHVIGQALAARQLDALIVVLGCQAEAILPTLAPFGDRIQIVVNPDWADGQATSVHSAVRALRTQAAPYSAAVFLLADQPEVTPAVVDALVEKHRVTLAPLVAPLYRGQRGNPVLFDRDVFDALLALRGDVGGRPLLQTYAEEVVTVAVDSPLPRDIDQMEDLMLDSSE